MGTRLESGGGERNRTADLLHAMQALYQLSYTPDEAPAVLLAEWTGLEPATPGVTGRYSNQLNYHSAPDCTDTIVPALRSSDCVLDRLELASPRGFEPRLSP